MDEVVENDYCNSCGATTPEVQELHLEEDDKLICPMCLKREEREVFAELAFITKTRARIERRRRKRDNARKE